MNLSGRKSAPPSRGPLLSRAPAHSTSLLNAQQERAQREAERQRLKATITIQRVWRGRKATEAQRVQWRQEWDARFLGGNPAEWLQGIALFLAINHGGFGKRQRNRDSRDLERMRVLVVSVVAAIQRGEQCLAGGDPKRSRYLLRRFARLLIEALDEQIVRNDALSLLPWLAESLPELVDASYYRALSRVTVSSRASPEAVLMAVLKPLKQKGDKIAEFYRVFAANYLTTPELPERLGRIGFEVLRVGVNTGMLVNAMEASPDAWTSTEIEERLWMLCYIIDFSLHQTTIDLTNETRRSTEDRNYIRVLSLLLSSVAREAGKRIDIEDVSMDHSDSEDEDTSDSQPPRQPLPLFIKSHLQGLIQQSSVSSVFNHAMSSDCADTKTLASFALTLLLVFPARKEEVRMWLCLAETADGTSAVRFLWEAVKKTALFAGITRDHRVAVESLKKRTASGTADDEEWNLILLFVELYGFLLIVMDDDEFLAGGRGGKKERQLPLQEVGQMSIFLKNLAFAMYWSGGEIMGDDKPRGAGGEVFLKDESGRGWDVAYLRGQVTGLLRLVYTREYVHLSGAFVEPLLTNSQFKTKVLEERELAHDRPVQYGRIHSDRGVRGGEAASDGEFGR